MQIVPLTLAEANDLVTAWHRHHQAVQQSKFCIGVVHEGVICGAAIVGRPVSRILDDGGALEVNRCVTNGQRNACSCLYGAVARSAKALGYTKVYTYIREDEPGTSLKASGWICEDSNIRARSWNMPGRMRTDKTEVTKRQRWVYVTGNVAPDWQWPKIERQGAVDLFAVR